EFRRVLFRSAVAELVLVGGRQLGAGAVALGHPEQRVVAEALFATWRMQDAPVPETFTDDRQRVLGVAYQRQGADELGAALGVRYVLQDVHQLGVVRRIALAVGIARRVDARRAAEMIDRKAGIVGQGRQAGHPRGVTGFEDGVLDERQAG